MADILPTKLQDLYNRLEARSKFPHTAHSLRQQLQNEQFQKREQNAQKERFVVESLDQRLYSLKNEKWNVQASKQKQIAGLCCPSCNPSSRASLCDEINGVSTMNVLNVEKLESHPKGVIAKIFSHICQVASFKMFAFPYIYDSVLKDERIQKAVEISTKELIDNHTTEATPSLFATMLKKQQDRAAKILTALRSTFSDLILRIAAYTMTKVFGRLFSSVIVNPTQINMLRRADSTNLPLIFLPLHRSHIDYIIITHILCNNNIRSPLVAAGENLRIPVFGWLLRGLGAFFIKRRVTPKKGEDILYKAILQTYMVHCLCAGHNFEFFIEGGRTRSGKPCMPKSGLLSVILDAYMDSTIDDALIVPVSINYERLVEGNFIREQMGEPKLAETFGSAIFAIWKALISHYGTMRVDFNQPFSLREMVTTLQKKISPSKKLLHTVPSSTSLFGTDVVADEHRQLVNTIARHVIYDCCSSMAIMSTNIVSFLLLYMFRDGVMLNELILALDKLRDDFAVAHKTIGFSGESIDVINHAVEMLGTRLVKKEKRNNTVFIKPITMLPNVIELSYYSNSVLPHFILEAVVSRSINTLLKENTTNVIYYSELLEKSQTLCEILQYEFIFTKPCNNLETELMDIIDKFIIMDILISQQASLSQDEQRSRRVARQIEGFDDDEYDDMFVDNGPQYYVEKKNKHYCFYNVLLQPFVDVYTSCALNLQHLVSRQVPEKDYIKEIIGDVKSRLNLGQFKYNECLAVDSIRNSLKLLEKWNVLDCHMQDSIKLYYLGENYNDEASLVNIVFQIEQYQ